MSATAKASRCPTCDGKLLEHKHTLNIHMIRALRRVAKFPGPVKLSTLEPKLERSEWDNFQKLRYFGLVEHVGHSRSGDWLCPHVGHEFLAGRVRVPARVTTFRGKVIAKSDRLVSIHDIDPTPGYRKHEDYARDARPHGVPKKQGRLF